MTTVAHETAPRQLAGSLLVDATRALRRPDVGAVLVVVGQLAVYAAVALPGSFYLDDLVATSRAAGQDLGASYLQGEAGHHLAPGAMLWFWLQAHVAPLDHQLAVLPLLLLQGLITLALWRLLRALFGPRPAALVPLAVYALTPLTLPTFAWWIQSVCLLPVHLSIIGATHQHLLYLRTRRLRHVLGSGLCVALGLLFWEKALLAAAVPFLLTLLCFTGGGPRARLRSLLSLWPAWLGLGLPAVGFLIAYGQSSSQPARSVSLHALGSLLWDSTTHAVVPMLLGGPWRWSTKEYYGIADPAGWQVALAGLVALAVVGATTRNRRAAWRGWFLLALYVPLSLAPVAAGRLAQYGNAVGRDSRYLTDIAVVAALGLGLALLPLREDEPARPPRPPRPLAGAALTGLLLASTTVSTLGFATRWHDNPTGDYLARLTADLESSRGSVALFDAQLPVEVLSPLYSPYNVLSQLLGQLPGEARFEDGLSPLSLVRDDGRIVAAVLSPAVGTVPGPDGSCGYAVTVARPSRELPLAQRSFGFVDRTLRVELLLSAPTRVTVQVTDGSSTRQVGGGQLLPRGPAAVVTRVPEGDIRGVIVSGLAPGVAGCALSATLGSPSPLGSP